MNHIITVGGLLLSIGAFFGFLMLCFGALATFAEGMSDAPSQGNAGCTIGIIGAVLFVACLGGLIL